MVYIDCVNLFSNLDMMRICVTVELEYKNKIYIKMYVCIDLDIKR